MRTKHLLKSIYPDNDYLNLSNQSITDNDIDELLPLIESISTLDLSFNNISERGARNLSKNTTLKNLYLLENNIRDDGAKAFAKNTTLTTLNLVGNFIGNDGAKALAKNTTLKKLDVGNNNIGDLGAKALAKNTTLTDLELNNNDIGNLGAKAFLNNTTLTHINLNNNSIDSTILKKVEEHIKNNKKTTPKPSIAKGKAKKKLTPIPSPPRPEIIMGMPGPSRARIVSPKTYFSGRPCNRYSRSPIRINRDELVAVAKWMPGYKKNMKVDDMCHLLGIYSPRRTSPKRSGPKRCSSSARGQNRYTRSDLVDMAKNKKIKGYSKMNMDELCKKLGLKT